MGAFGGGTAADEPVARIRLQATTSAVNGNEAAACREAFGLRTGAIAA